MEYIKRNRYRDSVSFLTENKTMFLIISGISGLIGQIFNSLTIFKGEFGIIHLCQFITIIFGFLYLYVLGRETYTKRAREEFKEFLDNKRNVKKLLLHIFEEQIQNLNYGLSEGECYNAIKKWHIKSDESSKLRNLFYQKQNLQSIIDDIGIDDFSNLLLTKSENLNLIKGLDDSEEVFYLLEISHKGLNIN